MIHRANHICGPQPQAVLCLECAISITATGHKLCNREGAVATCYSPASSIRSRPCVAKCIERASRCVMSGSRRVAGRCKQTLGAGRKGTGSAHSPHSPDNCTTGSLWTAISFESLQCQRPQMPRVCPAAVRNLSQARQLARSPDRKK
jgi:hypothetical protein